MWTPDEDKDLQIRLLIAAHFGVGGHRGLETTRRNVSSYAFWSLQKAYAARAWRRRPGSVARRAALRLQRRRRVRPLAGRGRRELARAGLVSGVEECWGGCVCVCGLLAVRWASCFAPARARRYVRAGLVRSARGSGLTGNGRAFGQLVEVCKRVLLWCGHRLCAHTTTKLVRNIITNEFC